MGNHPSADGSGGSRTVTLGGRRGSLGLTKSELDRRCKSSGLYPSCQWDDKAIRKLIGDGRLAARQNGNENRTSPYERECPICFLHYSQVNVTRCCQANLCTECYLQVRPQREKNNACPFCNDPKLVVGIAKRMETDEIEQREAEEQRVIQAVLNARAAGETPSADPGSDVAVGVPASPTGGFGSSLEQNETVRRMRARSESMSSDDAAFTDFREESLLRQLSLTLEDRRALEREMRAQHTHPLAQQIEAEAEQRRVANVQEYYRTNSGRLREARAASILSHRYGSGGRRGRFSRGASTNDVILGRDGSRRDWNQIVDAFERGGNGEVQTLDDLVVLEAALILSMEHENRQQNTAAESSDGASEFDAAQHARDGFPLVQELLNPRSEGGTENEPDAVARGLLGSSGRRSGRRSQLMRGGSSGRSALGGLSTGTLMRGVTEDEQMALAIALSLRESEAARQQRSDNDESDTQESASPTDDSGGQESVPVAEAAASNDNAATEPTTTADETNDVEQDVGTEQDHYPETTDGNEEQSAEDQNREVTDESVDQSGHAENQEASDEIEDQSDNNRTQEIVHEVGERNDGVEGPENNDRGGIVSSPLNVAAAEPPTAETIERSDLEASSDDADAPPTVVEESDYPRSET